MGVRPPPSSPTFPAGHCTQQILRHAGPWAPVYIYLYLLEPLCSIDWNRPRNESPRSLPASRQPFLLKFSRGSWRQQALRALGWFFRTKSSWGFLYGTFSFSKSETRDVSDCLVMIQISSHMCPRGQECTSLQAWGLPKGRPGWEWEGWRGPFVLGFKTLMGKKAKGTM